MGDCHGIMTSQKVVTSTQMDSVMFSDHHWASFSLHAECIERKLDMTASRNTSLPAWSPCLSPHTHLHAHSCFMLLWLNYTQSTMSRMKREAKYLHVLTWNKIMWPTKITCFWPRTRWRPSAVFCTFCSRFLSFSQVFVCQEWQRSMEVMQLR